MSGLMQALNAGESYPCPRERAERIIQLGELLLQKSTDCTQRQSALQSLCYAYETIDKTKALYYADLCGDFYAAKQGLRTQILDGEEGGDSMPKLFAVPDTSGGDDSSCFNHQSARIA